MGKPARLQLKVRHYEVDQYGHVNHAQYVHYLEVARIEALDALGLSLGEMRKQGYLILAADLAVKYLAPARSGDMLEIVTYVREIRVARSRPRPAGRPGRRRPFARGSCHSASRTQRPLRARSDVGSEFEPMEPDPEVRFR